MVFWKGVTISPGAGTPASRARVRSADSSAAPCSQSFATTSSNASIHSATSAVMSCLTAPSRFVARFVAIPPSITHTYGCIATLYNNSPSEFMHGYRRGPNWLGRIVSVYRHIFVRQVACDEPRVALSAPQIDGDRVLARLHRLVSGGLIVVFIANAMCKYRKSADRDRDSRRVELHASLARRSEQPAPVRVR